MKKLFTLQKIRSIALSCIGGVFLVTTVTGCQPLIASRVLQQNDQAQQTELSAGQYVQVPFKVVNQHILIPVSFNGSEPLDFVLDTGAPITALLETVKTDLISVEEGQEVDVGGAGKGMSVKAKLLTNSEIEVGNVKVSGLTSVMLPISAFPDFTGKEDAYFDGIIGHDLLSKYSVSIDHNTNMLTIYDAGTQPSSSANWRPTELMFNAKHPYIHAQLHDNTKVKLLLDTGSTNSLSLSPSTHSNIDEPAHYYKSESRGLSGVEVEHNAINNQLLFAGFEMNQFIASYSDGWKEAGSQGILGNTILNHFNLWFDYASDTMWVQAHDGNKPNISADRAGIKMLPTSSKGARVVKIYSDSTAGQLGLSEGDLIVSINEQQIHRRNFDLVNEFFKSESEQINICWVKSKMDESAKNCADLTLVDRI